MEWKEYVIRTDLEKEYDSKLGSNVGGVEDIRKEWKVIRWDENFSQRRHCMLKVIRDVSES